MKKLFGFFRAENKQIVYLENKKMIALHFVVD